jgi:hypothetical protein
MNTVRRSVGADFDTSPALRSVPSRVRLNLELGTGRWATFHNVTCGDISPASSKAVVDGANRVG